MASCAGIPFFAQATKALIGFQTKKKESEKELLKTNFDSKHPLADHVALVTGATRGVGKGIALQLGEAGCTVYITGRF